MDIGKTLRIFRNIKKVSQSNVAKALNMERSTYAKLEQNLTMLRMDVAQQIAEFYGMELYYFARCLEYERFISDPTTSRLILIRKDLEKRVEHYK